MECIATSLLTHIISTWIVCEVLLRYRIGVRRDDVEKHICTAWLIAWGCLISNQLASSVALIHFQAYLLRSTGLLQSVFPTSILVLNLVGFLIIRPKLKTSKICFIPTILFKICYCKHWLKSCLKWQAKIPLKILAKKVDWSLRVHVVDPMSAIKIAAVKGTYPAFSQSFYIWLFGTHFD